MKRVKITVMARAIHQELIDKYENPITHACEMEVGDEFVSVEAQCPKDFCQSAWQNIYPFVFALSCGGEDLYDGWMKNKKSAMISCNDGFRPVSYYIEALDD